MKTAYKQKYIPSPIQVTRERAITVQDNKHPVRDLIRKAVGTYNITATFEEDTDTLAMFKHIPGLVGFLCTLTRDGRVLGVGRGSAVFSSVNKYVDRTIHTAFNASLIDAIVRSTKVLDALCITSTDTMLADAYKAKESTTPEPITERQRSYLLELIQVNIDDEDERERWTSDVEAMTKSEASEAIQSFAE